MAAQRAGGGLDLRVSCGAKRGINPHRRGVPGYYQILAHVGRTGQILAVKNNPVNAYGGKRSEYFIHKVVRVGAE